MSVPNAPVRPTPTNLNPPETVCLQIEVPNDRQWIAAFYDAVEQLSYWYAWDRDEAHTGRDIAERWWKVFLSIRKCKPEQPMDGCCDGSEETLIRQNPDNPCLLESSADGIHWCTLFDQSLCAPANGQPGPGARQPASGGGEACYHADFPSTMQWNLPTVVNAGDTIEVKNTSGSATDAPNHAWYCPNGQLFFAGACVSVPFTQGGDPAVTANHMTIICQIAGVWYSCDSLVTVPGGVTNAPVVFQVNDGTLSDNSGGYSFDVCVTNNGAEPWSSLFDFQFDPYDWVHAGTDQGVWVAGFGWQVQCSQNAGDGGGGASYTVADIGLAFPSVEITKVSAHCTGVTIGTMNPIPLYDQIYTMNPSRSVIQQAYATAGAFDLTWLGDATYTNLHMVMVAGYHSEPSGPTPACPGGTGYIQKLLVEGKGTKPVGWP